MNINFTPTNAFTAMIFFMVVAGVKYGWSGAVPLSILGFLVSLFYGNV